MSSNTQHFNCHEANAALTSVEGHSQNLYNWLPCAFMNYYFHLMFGHTRFYFIEDADSVLHSNFFQGHSLILEILSTFMCKLSQLYRHSVQQLDINHSYFRGTTSQWVRFWQISWKISIVTDVLWDKRVCKINKTCTDKCLYLQCFSPPKQPETRWGCCNYTLLKAKIGVSTFII